MKGGLTEAASGMQGGAVWAMQVSEAEIRRAQKAEREQEKIKKTMKARMDFLDFD